MSKIWKGALVLVLLPLTVTIVGGLTVEMLKPRDTGSLARQQTTETGSTDRGIVTPSQMPQNEQASAGKPLIGKWHTGTSVGNRSLEFFPSGHVVCESDNQDWLAWPDGKTTTLTYHYDEEKGNLTIEGQDVSLVSIKDGKMVLSRGGKPITYSRSGWASFSESISTFLRGVVVALLAILMAVVYIVVIVVVVGVGIIILIALGGK